LSTEPVKGSKFDIGKPRFSLLPSCTLKPVLKVLEFGAVKYTKYAPRTQKELLETIRAKLCQENQQSVECAYELVVSLQEGCVLPVTVKTRPYTPPVRVVVNTDILYPPHNNAEVVMNVNASREELRSLLEKLITRKSTENTPTFVYQKDFETQNVDKTRTTKHKLDGAAYSIDLQNTELTSLSIINFYSEGAKSVLVPNVLTLTTTIKQGNSEIYFVVSAIKLLDCYKITQRLLEAYFNISLSIAEISKCISGVNNWQQVENPRERYYDAAMRHLYAWFNGEPKDLETGESHLAHAICCLLFLLWFESN